MALSDYQVFLFLMMLKQTGSEDKHVACSTDYGISLAEFNENYGEFSKIYGIPTSFCLNSGW